MDRLYFYQATIEVLRGLQAWIEHYAEEARRLARGEENPAQKREYAELTERLTWIAHRPPRTFSEALQLTYLLHTAVLNEDCISGLSPGRLGQVLWPWYEQDREAGRIDDQQVLEWWELYRVKLTCYDCFAAMGVVGGVLSGNTFNHLCLGGLTKDGASAVNPLEMLILEAGITCATPQPTLGVLYHEKLPEEFLLKAIETNKTGTGYPAWLNDETARTFLLQQYGPEGMTVEESRAWSVGGCLETSPGTWQPLVLNGKTYWIPGGSGQPTSVGVHFLSLPKILECILFNGYDHRRQIQVYPPHDRSLDRFEEVLSTFRQYLELSIGLLVKCNNIQHDIWRKQNVAVLHSLLKPDCLELGYHIGNLGYRYNATFNVESCGTANLINSLAALKKWVYEEKIYTLDEVRQAIRENFGYKTAEEIDSYSLATQEKRPGGEAYDRIHRDLLNAPKYGNDDLFADSLLRWWEDTFCQLCHHYQSLYAKPLYACQISVSTHGPQGAATLATPDGRLAGTTFADGS
ncbi:MAG: MFS transporter, partial [Coprothermobacterota bacterium]|nr:MFS transporter [Coprothermobacterota bacterium]